MTTKWFIISGAVLGVVAALLVYAGNPQNMGVCAACFLRDTTGALGFHRVETLQYIRPEIIGLIIGGFLSSVFWTKDFRATSNSSGFVVFFLGVFAMIGALVFLGCPWRAFLRLGGGDMSAIAGVVGLACGVGAGISFKNKGYILQDNKQTNKAFGVLPLIFGIMLLIALIAGLKLDKGAIFTSLKGPGSQHATILLSLVAGIIVGIFMQKSKLCSTGAFAKAFKGDFSMIWGIVAIIVSASIVNIALGQYHFGFTNQPIAHNNVIWNFLGMALAGLCFSLSNGCPGKHLVQMGSGNLGSVIFVIGMMAGAAISHNFLLASSANGITTYAPYAVGLGFIFAIFVGIVGAKKS